jgi:thymidylate kinase
MHDRSSEPSQDAMQGLGGGPFIPTLGECVTESKKTGRNLRDFLLTLFQLLENNGVQYCVVHSWETLPEELPNDLDLAITNDDQAKMLPVFDGLRAKGYFPIQVLNHSANGNFFVFFWTEPSGAKTAAVDIVSEHRRAGMTLATGEQMVANRQRQGTFWTASPEVEFAYLLAKKSFKRKASENQARRLKLLAEQLGTSKAERLASEFLPGDSNRRAVESCLGSSPADFLKDGRKKLWRKSVTRRPWKLFPYFGKEAWRLVLRWFQPTGITVAIIGPDGVGKSTVIGGLIEALDIAFWRRHRLFHWRPNIIAPKPDLGPVPDPHGERMRGRLASMLYLSGFFIDYYTGYLLLIRRLLAKSNLVLFDRYFHDVLVDPRRYRYGGPERFARVLSGLVPEPDLVILLDADSDLIRQRKSELPSEEIERQRQAYLQLRFKRARIVLVKTSTGIDESVCAAATAIAEYMKARFDQRLRGWLSSAPVTPEEWEAIS